MNITSSLAIRYLRKNNKKIIGIIVRNNDCHYITNFYICNTIKLSTIYDKYFEK